MRIQLLFNSGMDDRGQYLLAGEVFDVSEELALDLVKRNRAIRFVDKPKVETAAVAPPENTALRVSKPPPRKYK